MLDCIASGIPEALTSRVDMFLKSLDTLFQNEHAAREQRTRMTDGPSPWERVLTRSIMLDTCSGGQHSADLSWWKAVNNR